MVESKVCTDCGADKRLSEFDLSKPGYAGRRSKCKPCVRARNAKWMRENRERYRTYKKAYFADPENKRRQKSQTLLRNFGITLDEYEGFLSRQAGLCAICRLPETVRDKNGATKQLAVDHDHETGRVRGLLCFRCNCSVAQFEAPERLVRLRCYLWPEQEEPKPAATIRSALEDEP